MEWTDEEIDLSPRIFFIFLSPMHVYAVLQHDLSAV